MRRYAPLAIAAAVVTLGGCGGNDASRPFGELSTSDQDALRGYTHAVSRAATAYAGVVRAGGDTTGMRAAVDRMQRSLSRAQDSLLDIDSSKLRERLQRYSRAFEQLAAVLDRYTTYYEDTSAPADQQLESELTRELQDAMAETRRQDQELVNVLLDASSPGERARLRAEYRKAQRQWEQQAGATP